MIFIFYYDKLCMYAQVHSFCFFVWKIYQTKTVLTARTGRIAHNDRLVGVRMCEPCWIAAKAAIALHFKLIRIDGGTINKWNMLKKDWFIVLQKILEL